MDCKKSYLKIFNELVNAPFDVTKYTYKREQDLFDSYPYNEHIQFLHPKKLKGFIRPISYDSPTFIRISRIEHSPVTIFYSIISTSFGDLVMGHTDLGICYLAFFNPDSITTLQKEFPEASLKKCSTSLHTKVCDFLNGKHNHTFDLHVKATPFQLRVWKALSHLPEGQLTTYKYIAESIQHSKASIAVGAAIGKNPIALLIPCHRVIRQNGVWYGFRWGNITKASLLRYELQ